MAIVGCLEFAEDVMIEILARLPVKSLLQFKCVSKSWYDLINTPSFISKHLNHTSSSPHTRSSSTIIKYWNGDTNEASVSFLSNKAGEHELSRDVAMDFFDCDKGVRDVWFYGPCNGIICVVSEYFDSPLLGDQIALWNPETREIKRLSPSYGYAPRYDDDDFEVCFLQIGFGFDTRSNDYKEVRMIALEHRQSRMKIEEPLVEIEIEVYSASTDSWRKLDVFTPALDIGYAPSPYLNGFCYWWACDANGRFVLSFDFADEVFDKIPLPPDIGEKVVDLVIYNETIAFADNHQLFFVWVLNVEGDGEKKKSWTKLYQIMFPCAGLLGILSGGEALVITGNDYDVDNELSLYDPKTQQLKNLRVYNAWFYDRHTFQMVNYVESLVSFKGSYVFDPIG